MSDGGEFDPSAAAMRASGQMADREVDTASSTPSGDSTTADGTQDDESDGGDADAVGVTGALAAYVMPLFTAPTRGPTASTFEEYDVGKPWARILDGVSDYVLDLVDRDPGDSLGPIGKIGLGFTSFETDQGDNDSSSSSDDAGDGPDHGDAPVVPGVQAT